MRFLLLCTVALLLLTTPAKTEPVDSDEDSTTPALPSDTSPSESARGDSAESSPTPATASSEDATVSPSNVTTKEPVVDLPDPKEVRKVSRRLAKAQAELNHLKAENMILAETLEETKAKEDEVQKKSIALAIELGKDERKLQELQNRLNSEVEELCKPKEAEFAKLIEEETSRQLEQRKAELKRIYERKYQKVLKELRLKVRKEVNLEIDPTKTPKRQPSDSKS